MKLSFPQLPRRWRLNAGRHSASTFSFLPPPPLGSTPLAASWEPGTRGCQTVLGAREEARGSYTVASGNAPGEVPIPHVGARGASAALLASRRAEVNPARLCDPDGGGGSRANAGARLELTSPK